MPDRNGPERAALIRRHADNIRALAQDSKDAAMLVTTAYKGVEEAGLNRKAMKDALRIENMEPAQRDAYWDDLLDYLQALRVFHQQRLPFVERLQPQPANGAQADAKPNDQPPGEPKPPSNGAANGDGKHEDFERGTNRELGKRAALAGAAQDQNPNLVNGDEVPEGKKVAAQEWDAGWIEGHQQQIDRAAKAEGGNQRGRRKKDGRPTVEGAAGHA